MSSTLRRLSASLPFTSKSTTTTDSEPPSSPPSTSFFRRKSSSASAFSASADVDGTFRSLGARDYKLAMDAEEEKERRSSVAEYVADMTAVDVSRSRSEEEQGEEDVMVTRKASKGRIYGARDWRLIGKE